MNQIKLHRISVRIPLHQVNILEREQVNHGQSYSKTIRTLIDRYQENI